VNATTKFVLALLVLLALALGGFGYHTARKALTTPAASSAATGATVAPRPTVPVVVAARALQPGQAIGEDDVRLDMQAALPAGGLSDPARAIGQVPRVAIGSGAPVLGRQLLGGLSAQVAEGHRAVAIHVDKVIAVGEHLQPGDWVDVFFALPATNAGLSERERASVAASAAQSRLLLSRLRVLAVGPQTVETASVPPGAEETAQAATRQQPVSAVVLQVPVGDVPRLVMAAEGGKLQLALRRPDDEATPDATAFAPLPEVLPPARATARERAAVLQQGDNRAYAGVSLPGLRQPGPAARPAATGAAGAPRARIEIYRGDQKSVVSD